MKSLRQPPTVHRNLLAPISLTPLRPPKTHAFLTHLRTSSTKKFDLTATCSAIPPPAPADWINFIGPNRAVVVERHGKYFKTLRTGIHFLDPLVDNIVAVHSLKEQIIGIPLETVTSGNFEIVVDGHLYIKVVDPFLASYGNKDTTFAVTQLIQKTLPLRRMIEEIVFNPEFIHLKKMYNDACRDCESKGILDFETFRRFGSFYNEFFRHPGFEIDDDINKITTAWGIKCLYLKIYFYMPKEVMPKWYEIQDLLLHFGYNIFCPYCSTPAFRLTERDLFRVLRGKGGRIINAIEILREYYKRDDKDNDSEQYIGDEENHHGDS